MKSLRLLSDSPFLSIVIILSYSVYVVTVQASSPHFHNNHFLSRRNYSPPSSAAASSLSSKAYRKELNTINSWNVRSLSSLHLSAAQPVHISSTSRRTCVRQNRIHRRRRSDTANFNEFHNEDSSNNIVTLSGRRENRRQQQHKPTYEYEEEEEYQPSIEEMKGQLGPIGLLVANSVEVGIATASSYMSGGIFGYLIGGVMGVPTLFQKGGGESSFETTKNLNNNALKEFQRRMGNLNSKALTQGKSWATLSASFSGFHALTRVCRGGVEDRWNSIIGSACAGAYLSRQGGPQAMLQAASTYASFTYIIDMVFGSSSKSSTGLNKEFDFTDAPIQDRGY